MFRNISTYQKKKKKVLKHINNLCALEQIKTSMANTKALFLSFLIFKLVNHILIYSYFAFVFCAHFLILWWMSFLIINICYLCWMWILSLFDWKKKKGGKKKKKEKKREFNLVEDSGSYWDCIVIYYHVKIPILPKV